jgi:hypothetical protein
MSMTFDTSGVVTIPYEMSQRLGLRVQYNWGRLVPFQQGTLIAASEEASRLLGRQIGFSDWSGEALGRIMGDCEGWDRATAGYPPGGPPMTAEQGREFWQMRQRGDLKKSFPPLTFHFDNDGKVCLRETPSPANKLESGEE